MENNKKCISIAIDGPAGAGKSSISRAVAQRLGYVYIDTGAMYRASALYAIENDIEIERTALIPHLDEISIGIEYGENGQRILLNGADVSERIREQDVTIGSSKIAVIPEVRLKLVELQRALAENSSVIMDGRDIGTYVLPGADLKIFLTASVEERAKRRCLEMAEKGMDADFDRIKQDIIFRDKNDSEREFAPLKKAEDAVLVDTSELSFEESAALIERLISELG